MKVGDTRTVSIDGIAVTQATVTKVEGEQVTFEFPATRAVIKVKFVLTDEGPEEVRDDSKPEHIITADNPSFAQPVVEENLTTPEGVGITTAPTTPAQAEQAATAAQALPENTTVDGGTTQSVAGTKEKEAPAEVTTGESAGA